MAIGETKIPNVLSPIKVALDEHGRLPAQEEKLVREMADAAEKLRQDDPTEKMYLEDLRAYDIDNLGLVMKASKAHMFDDIRKANHYQGDALRRALMKLGVHALDHLQTTAKKQGGKVSPDQNAWFERLLQKQLLNKQVKVEPRKYRGNDAWRSGIYIYKGGEIAYWISGITEDRSGRVGLLVIPGRRRWFVFSNVPE